MKPEEQASQNALRERKPLVYGKVIRNGMRIVRIEQSYTCNMHCKHCSIRDMQAKQTRRAMSIDDIEFLADQAHEIGFSQFVISGGEPLLYPDFDDIVKAIKPDRFWITTDSNGWHLDQEKAAHLKGIGVDKVQISIDNLDPKVHDEFRQKQGAWSRAVQAVEYSKAAGLRVLVQTVVDKQRVYSDELVEFISNFNKRGVPVYISYAKPVGAYKGNYDVMIDADDMDHISKLEKEYQVFTHLTPSYDYQGGCIAMKRMVNITKYGDLNPCPFMQELTIGNIFEEPLDDIITRGMTRFKGYIPVCLMASDKEFIDGL